MKIGSSRSWRNAARRSISWIGMLANLDVQSDRIIESAGWEELFGVL